MARAKAGEAISARRRTPTELAKLDALADEAKRAGNLKEWRRARAVQRYIEHDRVIAIAADMDVGGAAVNQWLYCIRPALDVWRSRIGARCSGGPVGVS